eukprot:10594034-Alexandrium_andersonii.AAC.1
MGLDPVGGLNRQGFRPVSSAPANNVPPSRPESIGDTRRDGARAVVLMEVVPRAFQGVYEVPGMILDGRGAKEGARWPSRPHHRGE